MSDSDNRPGESHATRLTLTEYAQEELATQPIGYWSGATQRAVVGRIREDLAHEDLTQPHWWALNHIAGTPGDWTRVGLAERLAPFDDQATDFGAVFDDLDRRGWVVESDAGGLTLTEAGEAGRLRARDRARRANDRVHEGITTGEYVAALNVLRRMIANLGGNSDLPR